MQYTVNFIFKNCASALSFSFKAYKNADELYSQGCSSMAGDPNNSILDAEDDYDQRASIDMTTVSAITMGDVEKDMDRQGEVGLIQARSQMKAQKLANSDSALRQLSEAAKPTIIKAN